MSERPKIYTAGVMDWQNGEDSYWRESIDIDLDEADFLHPHETWFDHGGDYVKGAVAEDMSMIARSDAVVALFTERVQVGTLVETVYAAEQDKPVLVLLDRDELRRESNERIDGAKKGGSVEMRGEARDHWFLINYLCGDSVSERPTAQNSGFPSWIRDWSGRDGSVVWVDADNNQQLTDVVRHWLEEGFTIESEAIGSEKEALAEAVAGKEEHE